MSAKSRPNLVTARTQFAGFIQLLSFCRKNSPAKSHFSPHVVGKFRKPPSTYFDVAYNRMSGLHDKFIKKYIKYSPLGCYFIFTSLDKKSVKIGKPCSTGAFLAWNQLYEL